MKKRIHRFFVLVYFISHSGFVFSQVPSDFKLIANAGGGEIWQDYTSLRIDAQGNVVYNKFSSKDFASEKIETQTFTLTAAQVNDIWQSVNNNNFFSLNTSYSHPFAVGRTFARLAIIANGTTRNVITQNISVPQFDIIMTAINGVTPENMKLMYDTSSFPVIVPKELCNRGGARILKTYANNKAESDDEQTPDIITSLIPSHPGTTMGCKMSLEEAVAKGLVELTAKGEFEGDAISVKVDNTAAQECDRLTLNLALEFYGENALTTDALRIQNAIQEGWKDYKTSEGKNLDVLVDVKISPGATEAPGTPGYHQIELVDGESRSYLENVEEVNGGTGSGKWERNTEDKVYAHEAGHLMGLDDQYDDYNKLPDGRWENAGNGEVITSEELAQRVDTEDPTDRTYQEILDKVSDPDFTTGSVPKPGHWHDIMGSTQGNGKARQAYIDEIAASPGLIVDIPAGSTFLNESTSRQNMASTRSDYMFTGSGESRQLDGVYATCIDGDKGVPRSPRTFDLGPHLSKWNGIESADAMLKLLQYIDRQNLFCDGSVAVYAAWRISDNYYVGDQYLNDLFIAAGIQPRNTAYDFPRMINPSNDGETGNVLPHQLFISNSTAAPAFVNAGELVNLNSSFSYPTIPDQIQTTGEWMLTMPEGSSAALTDWNSPTSSFIPDIRGIYELQYNVRVDGLEESFDADATNTVVVAQDEWTETFESGILEGNSNINWVTYGNAPWKITEFDPHSGAFCVESGAIADSQFSTLRINLVVPADDEFTFAYKVSSSREDSLLLMIDDVVVRSRSGETGWKTETVPITAGAHFISWTYKKNDVGYEGFDKVWIDNIIFPQNSVLTSIAGNESASLSYKLEQNYPNPFNPTTQISFSIPQREKVLLNVYDVLGRKVAELLNEDKEPGKYTVEFNASGLASGIYFYRLRAGNFTASGRMLLLR